MFLAPHGQGRRVNPLGPNPREPTWRCGEGRSGKGNYDDDDDDDDGDDDDDDDGDDDDDDDDDDDVPRKIFGRGALPISALSMR